jgi:hypothetical protein
LADQSKNLGLLNFYQGKLDALDLVDVSALDEAALKKHNKDVTKALEKFTNAEELKDAADSLVSTV